jgi:hypothetical protein
VEHQADRGEAMSARVLEDAISQGAECLGRHRWGPSTPAGVFRLVDVAMITCQVATAVNLDYVLS